MNTTAPVQLSRLGQISVTVHDLWLAFFRDPEGSVLALTSEVPHS